MIEGDYMEKLKTLTPEQIQSLRDEGLLPEKDDDEGGEEEIEEGEDGNEEAVEDPEKEEGKEEEDPEEGENGQKRQKVEGEEE